MTSDYKINQIYQRKCDWIMKMGNDVVIIQRKKTKLPIGMIRRLRYWLYKRKIAKSIKRFDKLYRFVLEKDEKKHKNKYIKPFRNDRDYL